jgi:hypothetical protein
VHAEALEEDGVAGRQVVEGDDCGDPGLDIDGGDADRIEDLPDDVEPPPVCRAYGRGQLPGAGFGESLHATTATRRGRSKSLTAWSSSGDIGLSIGTQRRFVGNAPLGGGGE